MTQTGADAQQDPGNHQYEPLDGSAQRLAAMLEELAALSEPGDGVSRLAYTALERRAHGVFARWMSEIGLTVRTDSVGNTIAVRDGARPDLPAIGTGSHLDTVPHGGAYDGMLGVVAAVEVARTFVSHGYQTMHPMRFVAWAGEEGARFGQACLGSRMATGLTGEHDLHRLRDSSGTTLAQAMSSVGFDPDGAGLARWHPADVAAFVELHIEQGTVLERDGFAIGVADLISGSTRMELGFRGRASHTGGTPMHGRSDALAAAAEVVLMAEQVATDSRHHGTRATVSRLTVEPGSITTIPGHVVLSVDVRDVDADRQRETALTIIQHARDAAERREVRVEPRLLGDTSPVVLTTWLRELLSSAADRAGVCSRTVVSGASHDVQVVNSIAPAGLIFVRSAGGLSHTPEEHSTAEDCARGAAVLGQSLRDIDAFLAARPGPLADSAVPGRDHL